MIVIDSTSVIPATAIRAKARIVRDGRIEVFNIALSNASDAELKMAVDILDGQIGDVLSINRIDDGAEIYKSMFESWELGAR